MPNGKLHTTMNMTYLVGVEIEGIRSFETDLTVLVNCIVILGIRPHVMRCK